MEGLEDRIITHSINDHEASKDRLSTSITTEMMAIETQRSFCAQVLRLGISETENQLDEGLQMEMQELGLSTGSSVVVQPTSMVRTSFVEVQRRPDSLDSRTTHSTGFTSTFSGTSQTIDHGKRLSKASFRDYDSFISSDRRDGRPSASFSPTTTPSHSTFSLSLSSPASSPKKSFLNLRGMSMRKLLRTEPNRSIPIGCPHCPHDAVSRQRARHALPCGHRLCTQALRQNILSASANPTAPVASCCGKPIPGSLIEQVMTADEQRDVLGKLQHWDHASSLAPSVKDSIQSPSPATRPTADDRKILTESKRDSVGSSYELLQRNRTLADFPEYHDLRQQQQDENDRFAMWLEQRREEVQKQLEQLRIQMTSRFEAATEDLIEHHATAIAWAEDKQVRAEADMREAHDLEKQNNATALKHMEAYCAGTYSSGEAHGRTVTEQALLELEKERKIRDTMDFRHVSAINVLRGGQNRRMKLRDQRYAKELQELRRTQRLEELELERACTAEGLAFERGVVERRERMGKRWEVREAIVAKRAEIKRQGLRESDLAYVRADALDEQEIISGLGTREGNEAGST